MVSRAAQMGMQRGYFFPPLWHQGVPEKLDLSHQPIISSNPRQWVSPGHQTEAMGGTTRARATTIIVKLSRVI